MASVVLITGFLGSGKTTLLKVLLKQYSKKYTITVIQNEFSDASIDSNDLRMTKWKFELIEINKGSIFCICLYSNFRAELERIVKEKNPDLIIIEASGLADPLSIGVLLNDCTGLHLSSIITVVDPSLFLKMYGALTAVKNQIRVADIVMINKCDKSDKERVKLASAKIREINLNASINYTNYGELTDEYVSSPITLLDVESVSKIDRLSNEIKGDANLTKRPEDIHSNVFRTTKQISQEEIHQFCKSIPDSILRLKGFLKCSNGKYLSIQYVIGDDYPILIECDKFTKSEIIAIGTKISDFNFFEKFT